ncbi:hypothetical protein MMC07_001064 [Pseudocyphellaria aurata]|nr:hypothetical protein [Pseudocyphellaria aurata]
MNIAPIRLTFGIELEFIVRYDPEEYQEQMSAGDGKYWPEDSHISLHYKYGVLVRQRIIQVLNQHGFLAHRFGFTDVLKWTVGTDETVSADDSTNTYAIELKSPALEYSSPALEQVKMVVELLVTNFNLFVNKTCSLHVHVGNETRGFPLHSLKSFASLITVFEDQLISLHPPDRIHSAFAKPTSHAFHEDASPREKLLIIDKLETVNGFLRLFHPISEAEEFESDTRLDRSIDRSIDRYMAFNFSNLREDERFKTIEFRQHKGTLDSTLVVNWVRVACNLVHMSCTNGESFRDLIEKHIDDTDYNIIDLFMDLKLSDLAKFYAPLIVEFRNASTS